MKIVVLPPSNDWMKAVSILKLYGWQYGWCCNDMNGHILVAVGTIEWMAYYFNYIDGLLLDNCDVAMMAHTGLRALIIDLSKNMYWFVEAWMLSRRECSTTLYFVLWELCHWRSMMTTNSVYMDRWTTVSRNPTMNLQIYSPARYHRAIPTPIEGRVSVTWNCCH